MPCPRSKCFQPKTFKAEDGTEMQTWMSVRFGYLRRMRRMVMRVVFWMALLEAIRLGPDKIVYAGTHGYAEAGPEDYGIVYTAAKFLSWLYLCVFSVIWKVFFSWWASLISSGGSSDGTPSTFESIAAFCKELNMWLMPLNVGLCLVEYVYNAIMTFIYVEARPVDSYRVPSNSQKNWMARLMLVVGVFTSMTFGYGVFQTLAEFDLVHYKCLEYMIIVMPIQTNIGVLFASLMQRRMEKRNERRLAKKDTEQGTVDEKEVLLEV